MANGLLFASFDFSAAHEDEFHDWYDLEHIPERLRVPGFINAERWIGDENPKIAVATYDLANRGCCTAHPIRRSAATMRRSGPGASPRCASASCATKASNWCPAPRGAGWCGGIAGGDDERRSGGGTRVQ